MGARMRVGKLDDGVAADCKMEMVEVEGVAG
jgi:hypothetical protein